jgi:alanine racemase
VARGESRPPAPRFFRPTWAEIDRPAFLHNLRTIASRLGKKTKILAVLKADGYGHGAVPLAKAMAGKAWGIGVSSVEEGITLRRAGVKGRVLILGSLFPFDSFAAALDFNLTPTVASWSSALALSKLAARRGLRVPVHVKVDTGMARVGMTPDTALDVVPRIAGLPALVLEGVYTHLAQADSAARVRGQLALFDRLMKALRSKGLRPLFHAANSAGALLWKDSRYDLVRPGLALFGAPPAPGVRGLRPVLSWKTRVVFLKTVPKGTLVSYGGTFRASRRSRLATLPVGYADGYRRAFSNRGHVLIRGVECPVAGRVTMDQTVVDVTDVPGVAVGEEAVLLGAQGRARVTADDLAAWADTLSYEILCGISPRVPRVHR